MVLILQLLKKIKLNIFGSKQVWLEYDEKTKINDLLDNFNQNNFGLVDEQDF